MQHGWFMGFLVVFVARLVAETWVKPRQTERRPAQHGKISLQLLSLPFLASGAAIGWLLWQKGTAHPALYILGMLLFILGFAGRTAALHELGRSYSLYIDPAPTEELRTQGVYAFIRHPVYAFYLLETLALFIIRPNRVSLMAFLLVALATAWRIREEEKALLARYGEEYRGFITRTRRMLPWIY